MYAAIWDKAEQWLRLAMDLSLVTLLRREDVVSLKFADVRDGYLWVVPQKTEGSTLVKLKIRISDHLAACWRTNATPCCRRSCRIAFPTAPGPPTSAHRRGSTIRRSCRSN
ncbi:integrase [Stenotrophomonas sp. 2619]|uniref:hypothetical protein n=1 Tax=Stenotrophomonas sp. 2619 TaxID=3156316 RepID=UPI0033945199